jgi:hypothetical protein
VEGAGYRSEEGSMDLATVIEGACDATHTLHALKTMLTVAPPGNRTVVGPSSPPHPAISLPLAPGSTLRPT